MPQARSRRKHLRQRPRAIGQLLELSTLYTQQPEMALALADRVVHENVTVVALRTLIRSDCLTIYQLPCSDVLFRRWRQQSAAC
jgi:hypothetical protein